MATSAIHPAIPSNRDRRPRRLANRVGVWIDGQKANIIRLDDGEHQLSTVTVNVQQYKHILTSKLRGAASPNPGVHFDLDAQEKLDEEYAAFIRDVVETIGPADRVVVFGPAYMKNELGRVLRKDPRWKGTRLDLLTSDRMTTYQKIAWVKRFFGR